MKRLALTLLTAVLVTSTAWSAIAADRKGPRQLVTRSSASSPATRRTSTAGCRTRPRREVTLQRWSKHGWLDVRRSRTDRNGAFGFTVTASSHIGTTKYRVVQGTHRTETTKVQVVKPGAWT